MTQRERFGAGAGPRGAARCGRLAIAVVVAAALTGQFAAAEVTVHDPEAAFEGLNLRVTRDPSGAVLMDMAGNTLHTWTCRLEDVFPGAEVPDVPGFSRHWTTARLLPDGGVLGVFGGVGLVKLDIQSRVVWAHAGGEHSDIDVADDGRIYVLGSESNRVNWVNQKEAVVEDFVLVLDEQGEVLSRVSLLTAISSSDFDNIIKTSRMPRSGHVLGANSVQVLDGGLSGKVPSFTEGSVLVSLSGLDTIGVVDMESGSLTWTLFGMWLDQRDATLLPGGSVLLLEYPDDAPGVIEFGPVTMAVEWAYSRAPSRPLDDWWGGRVQRLPNGNTLVSESGRGTAFEVTPGGEVVWEYVNSEDGNGAAMPFEVTRIDPGFSVDRLGD